MADPYVEWRIDERDYPEGGTPAERIPGPPRRRPVGTLPTPGATVDGTVVRTTLRFEECPDMDGRP